MRDNLKNYIEQQREDFDVYPFDTKTGWKKVEPDVFGRKEKWTLGKIAAVAACFLLVISGAVFYSESSETNEIVEMERFYQGQINYKLSLVKNRLPNEDVLRDLEEMDAAFAELRADLNEHVDNEEVIMAMMENYRLKLQILEEILNELEKEKNEEIL